MLGMYKPPDPDDEGSTPATVIGFVIRLAEDMNIGHRVETDEGEDVLQNDHLCSDEAMAYEAILNAAAAVINPRSQSLSEPLTIGTHAELGQHLFNRLDYLAVHQVPSNRRFKSFEDMIEYCRDRFLAITGQYNLDESLQAPLA